MLKAYARGENRLVALSSPEAMANAVWFDLHSPRAEEYALVTRLTGLSLPEQPDIMEIENSSRLSAEGDVLTLTMPIVTRGPDGLHASACGFVLSPDRVVTIRFAESILFDTFATKLHEFGSACDSGHLFAALLEAIVDRQADALETLRAELDQFSHKVFRERHDMFSVQVKPEDKRQGKRPRTEEAKLRHMLVTLGIAYDTISNLRDSQLGIARIAPYAAATATWLPKPVVTHLQTLQTDVNSLNEFSTHLTDKVQFLLDATFGLINISQNTLIKVLTIVSIVGIPPTLIAGIYGMNFKDIPELSWSFGYGYAWTLMILSAVLPLAWFRRKGWL